MPEHRRENKLLELEIARQNRRFEISMFWQRANYFLVLNTALAIGAYTVSSSSLALFISFIGITTSWLWFRTNTGAKFWQIFWEKEVARLSKDLGLKALYEKEEHIFSRAKFWKSAESSPWHKRLVHSRIINSKPEVSHNMILLSLLSLLAWGLIILFLIAIITIQYCSCI